MKPNFPPRARFDWQAACFWLAYFAMIVCFTAWILARFAAWKR